MQGEEGKRNGEVAADGDAFDHDISTVELLQALWFESTFGSVDLCGNVDCQQKEALRFMELGQGRNGAGKSSVSLIGSDRPSSLFGFAEPMGQGENKKRGKVYARIVPEH